MSRCLRRSTRRALSIILALIASFAVSGQTVVPVITGLNPATAQVGSAATTVTVLGDNFVSGSVVIFNSVQLTTIVVGPNQLNAAIPATLLAFSGSAFVSVLNPDGTRSGPVLFTIAGSPVVIATDSLPQGSVNAPYNAQLTATGGTPPYVWTAVSTLPPGLAVNTAGSVSGTPTTTGSFTFSISTTDAKGQSVTKQLTLTIAEPPFTISVTQLPTGTVGQPYNQALTVSGGTAPYNWVAGQGIPAGLRLDTTGVLSGTPTQAGTFTFSVQVTDAAQRSASKSLTMTVNPQSLVITTTAPLFSGTVGLPYAQNFSAAGGVPPYRWTITSGSTAPLTLDSASGTLQGTPTAAGSLSFTVSVTDSRGATASQPFSVTISQRTLTISTPSVLPGGTETVPYSQSFSAIGGTTPYTWSVVSGIIPGLTLSPAGVLSGVPEFSGTYNLTLRVQDTSGLEGSRTFILAIGAPPLGFVSDAQLPNGRLNEPFAYMISARGGNAPYTWLANGLPEGLSIDSSTGTISGTPTAAGSFAFTVRLTDASRATAVDLFRLTVNLPPTPSVVISGLPEVAAPAQQIPFRISLASEFPAPISGQAILTFAPESGAGDSTIQFASGGRTAAFTVPTNTTEGVTTVPLAIQTGTVAGTISVSLRMQAGGIDITPVPAPIAQVRIERSAPSIQSARVVRSGNGLSLEITGFSTTREVTQLSVTFTASSGQTLQNPTVSVPVEDVFSKWFQDPASSQFGSQFLFTQPFTISGDVNAVAVQSVTLTNRIGSQVASIQP